MTDKSIREQLALWTDTTQVINVASVPQRSPFRYPGGKTWLVPRIRQWLASIPKPKHFIEPFAGGAIVGLTVAFEKYADEVILVEKDEQVAAVWRTIINDNGGALWLAEKIIQFQLSPDSAKELLARNSRSIRLKAFQTVVQNRISHGGILAPGAGALKHGENGKGVLSRWYPETLKRRILDISHLKEKIRFVQGDGIEIIHKYKDDINAAFFIDPPYTVSTKKAGTRLYKYHQLDHEKLFHEVSQVKGDFLITYDDAEEVRALARNYRLETRTVAMSNTHHATMNELLISRDLHWLGIEQ
ncbi:MAG: DNA adenine methylase [Anaerolineales bacterium]|nr:DNA adenine methylase [Anaerolineales bacterium]